MGQTVLFRVIVSVRWTVVKRRRDGEMYDGMHSVLTNSLCPKVSANTSCCSRLTGFKMSVILEQQLF